MCCREFHDRRICLKEPFGATNRGPIFQVASGCLTPDMANSHPVWPVISPRGWRRLRKAIMPEFLFYIAWPIAGCRGTQPSALSPSAIQMSPGIARGPMAGVAPAFLWRMPRQSRVPANSPSSIRPTGWETLFRHRVGVQVFLDCTCQIEQPLLDENRYVADI